MKIINIYVLTSAATIRTRVTTAITIPATMPESGKSLLCPEAALSELEPLCFGIPAGSANAKRHTFRESVENAQYARRKNSWLLYTVCVGERVLFYFETLSGQRKVLMGAEGARGRRHSVGERRTYTKTHTQKRRNTHVTRQHTRTHAEQCRGVCAHSKLVNLGRRPKMSLPTQKQIEAV